MLLQSTEDVAVYFVVRAESPREAITVLKNNFQPETTSEIRTRVRYLTGLNMETGENPTEFTFGIH